MPFRIQRKYVARWWHEFDHANFDLAQRQAVQTLSESMMRVLGKRDDLQAARGVFGYVSVYGVHEPSRRQQQNLYHATEEFFHAYYVAISDLSSLIKRMSKSFGSPPSNSIGKFITWWGNSNHSMFMDSEGAVLESARAFRAMINHRADRPTYNWHTANDHGLVRIILLGPASRSGVIPDGAVHTREGWSFLAPDEDRVTTALAVQMSAVAQISVAQSGVDPFEIASTCTWEHPNFEEDTSEGYPVFAAFDFEVTGRYRTTIEKRVRIERLDEDDSHG